MLIKRAYTNRKKLNSKYIYIHTQRVRFSGFAKLVTTACICLFSFCPIFCQYETLVTGQVFDKHDKTPLSSVNIYFKNTNIGTTSNNEGFFIIRSWGQENTLVFSSVGYQPEEIKVNIGEPAYVDVMLKEKNTWLTDVFVLPGTNPATEWMKKIRLMRKENDLTNIAGYEAESKEQDLVLLSKLDNNLSNKKLFEQMQKGSLSGSDSVLVVPLYMAEKDIQITSKGKKEINKNTFSSPDVADRFVAQVLKGLDNDINFYHNSVNILGKSFISPLANIGSTYYRYYLTDSIESNGSKQYEIRYRSKNDKNLAFNGKLLFDSASLALTYIEANLPSKANVNLVEHIVITQDFEQLPNQRWSRKDEKISMRLSYDLFADSLSKMPKLMIHKSSEINISDKFISTENFAQSGYSILTLEEKMEEIDDIPLIKTAKWIADVALTGYAQVGPIDIGKLQQVMRLTDVEGLRMTLPLRTNEHLWKNISIGGYAGYAMRTKEIKWSAFAQYRLPLKKRNIIGVSYTDDYRRITYDYNHFTTREDPWEIGDDDIVNTMFSFEYGLRSSPRKEWALSYLFDWTNDVESSLYLRHNTLFSNNDMPLYKDGQSLKSISQQSVTFSTRFSFGERKYEDHLQRIYIHNSKPVIYGTIELGQSIVGGRTYNYSKILGSLKQSIQLGIGEFNYLLETGVVTGKMPYPLLEITSRTSPRGISYFNYHNMNLMEFASDNYFRIHSEFIFNGILFNHIPLIKYLNLREVIAFNVATGELSDKHWSVLDRPDPTIYPLYMKDMKSPYLEASFGITNIFRIFRIQLNWRITNIYEGINPLGFSAGVRFGF